VSVQNLEKCLQASLENLNEFPNLHFIGNINIPILKLIQIQILVEKPQRFDIGNLFSENIKTDPFQKLISIVKVNVT
jgi:hypothetical protein